MLTNLLEIHWNMNPELFRLGGLAIRWYSLLFVGGFIVGYYIFKWFCRRENIKEDMVDSLLYTLLIATIIGARLGHCIFYQPDYYFGSWQGFWEIFMPWKGGLASHGGAIALLLAMWWFVAKFGKKYNIDYLWIMDRLCLTVAFAGCMIRLGNLCNSEIYGDVTSLPWGVVFERNGETLPKHPTQIYEALCYLVLGLIMVYLYKNKSEKLHRGSLFGIFLIGCFGSRFLIEFIKEPQVGFEQNMTLDMGQLLSIPFIITGIVLCILAAKWKKPLYAQAPSLQKKKKEETHFAKPTNREA